MVDILTCEIDECGLVSRGGLVEIVMGERSSKDALGRSGVLFVLID